MVIARLYAIVSLFFWKMSLFPACELPVLRKRRSCPVPVLRKGAAPLTQAAHRGLEDRRIKLGCVMPGESPAVFGDALRRLAGAATYLYQDGPRYINGAESPRAREPGADTPELGQQTDPRTATRSRRLGGGWSPSPLLFSFIPLGGGRWSSGDRGGR